MSQGAAPTYNRVLADVCRALDIGTDRGEEIYRERATRAILAELAAWLEKLETERPRLGLKRVEETIREYRNKHGSADIKPQLGHDFNSEQAIVRAAQRLVKESSFEVFSKREYSLDSIGRAYIVVRYFLDKIYKPKYVAKGGKQDSQGPKNAPPVPAKAVMSSQPPSQPSLQPWTPINPPVTPKRTKPSNPPPQQPSPRRLTSSQRLAGSIPKEAITSTDVRAWAHWSIMSLTYLVEFPDLKERQVLGVPMILPESLKSRTLAQNLGLQGRVMGETDNKSFQARKYRSACKYFGIDEWRPEIPGLKVTLEPYQVTGIEWCIRMEDSAFGGGVLGDFAGSGKSIHAIGTILAGAARYEAGDPLLPTLILYPASMGQTWRQKLEQQAPGIKVIDYSSARTKLKRTDPIFTGRDKNALTTVVICSYESWAIRHPGPGTNAESDTDEETSVDDGEPFGSSREHDLKGCFGRLICDEAHLIKGGWSRKRARAVLALDCPYRHMHTATPIPNKVSDFMGILTFFQRPEWAGGYKNAYGPDTDTNSLERYTAESFKEHILPHFRGGDSADVGTGVQRLTRIMSAMVQMRNPQSTIPEAVGSFYDPARNPTGVISINIPLCRVVTISLSFNDKDLQVWTQLVRNLMPQLYRPNAAEDPVTRMRVRMMRMETYRRLALGSTFLALGLNFPGGNLHLEGGEEVIDRAIAHNYKQVQEWRRAGVDLLGLAQQLWPNERSSVTHLELLAKFHRGHPKLSFLTELVLREVIVRGGKIVIFTQWPVLAYILELYFKELSVSTLALHTALVPGERSAVVGIFNNSPTPQILISTFGISGLGIDLQTRCSIAVLYETAINQTIEEQSIGRIYRRGQTSSPVVYRLDMMGGFQYWQEQIQRGKWIPIFLATRTRNGPLKDYTPEEVFNLKVGRVGGHGKDEKYAELLELFKRD